MDQRPLRLAFYGDDFTGSTDALEVLAFAGLRCALFLDVPTPDMLARLGNYDAIGVAGDSRGMSPAEMDGRLPAILEQLMKTGAPIVHYKVCSTFDSAPDIGNIGRVMEIARRRNPDRTISIVAGTPDLGRYCAFGNLFARSGTDGEIYRIDRHPIMSRHPITPMHHGSLIDHFAQQTALPIVGFSFPYLDRGPDAAAAHLALVQSRKSDAILFDSCNATHLAEVARLVSATASAATPAFVVGGSGVEHGLVRMWQANRLETTTPAQFATFKPVDRILAVSGSASKLTSAQIETAIAAGFVDLPAIARDLVSDGWRQSSDALVTRALAALAEGRSVLVHTAKGTDDARIGEMREAMMLAGHSAADATLLGGRLLAQRLGLIIHAIVTASGLRRIVISGGDTSSQVTKVLAPDALEVVARLAPGAPLCRMLSSRKDVDNIEIALKGGQMGDADYFVTARNGTP